MEDMMMNFTKLSDTQLWKVAHQQMDTTRQFRLEQLAEMQKRHPLSPAEQYELASLMQEAQLLMLSKAEAARLLGQRGHQISPVIES